MQNEPTDTLMGGTNLAADDIEKQVELLYQETARQLYSLAFYSIGNPKDAEDATVKAFAEAFHQLSDKLNVERFQELSIKRLYKHGKAASKKLHVYRGQVETFNPSSLSGVGKKELIQMLRGLCYQERYIFLLFCKYKFTAVKITEMLRIPLFVTKKMLFKIISKVAEQRKSCL